MRPNWSKFATVNEDPKQGFETLSAIIFSDIIGAKVQNVPKNYPGLEAKPTKTSDGKNHGYQCKYFSTQDAPSQARQIKESFKSIKDKDLAALSTLHIFVNSISSGVQAQCNTAWKKKLTAKGLTPFSIQWHCGIDFFFNYLQDPKFEGVMALFFGSGRPMQLHASNIPDKFRETRAQKYYLTIPTTHDGSVVNPHSILSDKSSTILVQSRAGTGKSWLMYDLAFSISEEKLTYKEQLINIYKHGLVLLLTAHECSQGSAIDVISTRLSAYDIGLFDYPITLMIDAIDEISSDAAKYLTESLNKLLSSKQISRLVITSRTFSTNSLLVISKLKPSIYDIMELDTKELVYYFTTRGDKAKTRLLKQAIKQKNDLSTIRNIRMLSTAWEVVNSLEDFSLENMFQKVFENEVRKQSFVDANILEPVKDSLEIILQKQAYFLQQKETFDFPLSDMQKTILDTLPRVNYKDTNWIINCLQKICIDATAYNSDILQFSNRSWVDFFTARYLAHSFIGGEYASIVEFAAYEDFLNTWFIPVTRKISLLQGNVPLAISIGVIQSYVSDDYTIGWVDKEAELYADIGYAAHESSVVEHVSPLITNSEDLKLIRYAFESGMQPQAKQAFDVISNKFRTQRKINSNTWENIASFYYLEIRLNDVGPIKCLNNFQDIIEINSKKQTDKLDFTDGNSFASKLVSICNMLTSLGVETISILHEMRPLLIPYFFAFIVRPGSIAAIRASDDLKKNIIEAYKDYPDHLLILKGLIFDSWSKADKKLANNAIDELNKENYLHDSYPFSHNVRRLALLRILGYSTYDENTYQHVSHEIITLDRVFDVLYSMLAYGDWQRDVDAFISWISADDFSVYSYGAHEGTPTKKAISELLIGIIEILPIRFSKLLVNSLKDGATLLYLPYTLMQDVYKHDVGKFRSIFSYHNVTDVMLESRTDPSSRQSALGDFAQIIGMYSSEDLLLYLTNSKRDARLRYGYRKDIMGFFLTRALDTMWDNGVYGIQQLKDYAWRIYRIILRILELTDGASTHWLPNYLFDVLCKYDFEFAEEVYAQFKTDYPYRDYGLASILVRGAIKRGDAYKSIVHRLNQYTPSYLEAGRVLPDYYEEQIICLSDILASNHYSSTEKLDAFTKMSRALSSLIKESKHTHWKYKPSSTSSSDLLSAAKVYRKYKHSILNKQDYAVFPYPHKQTDTFSDDYHKKQKEASKKARELLRSASSTNDVTYILEHLVDDAHSYLLSTDSGAQEFVEKLAKYEIPYDKIKRIVNRSIEEHWYGSRSTWFVRKLWQSTYRSDLQNHLVSSPHHSDLETVLQLFKDDKDSRSMKQLVEYTTSIIELLVRPSEQTGTQ